MKNGFHMLKYGLYAGSAMMALAVPAHAQQAAADTAAAAPATGEIIVTAQRRNESLQDVPMTLQALSADSLSKLNVTTFNDLLKYTPNVTFGNNGPGQGAIFMRGLSAGYAGEQSAGTIGGFPNVAIYLDDQSMQFPAHNADVYVADIERVEVLEGPQGTLFGGGAQAGAVRYITAKPKTDKFEAKFEGTFGGTAGGAPNASFNAMVNVPVVQDKLAIRAVIYDDHHGGYINNVYSTFTREPTDLGSYYLSYKGNGNQLTPSQQVNNGQYNNANLVKNDSNPVDYIGGRISVGWKISPDWDLLVSETYQRLDAEGSFATQSFSYDYQPLTGLSSTLFEPNYNKDEYWNTAWSVNGKIGDFKLVYTGAYMTRQISSQGDYTNYARSTYGIFYQCTGAGNYYWGTYGGAPYCYQPNSYWTDHIRTTHESHEFRVTTPESKRIRAILGAYYESFKIQDNQDWDYKSIPTCDPSLTNAQNKAAGNVCLGLVAPNPNATLNVQGPRGPAVAFGEDTQRGYKQYAAFGSVDFDITPTLTLTGGTRYYNYKEYETGSVYSSFNYACYQVPVCATGSNLDADNLHASFHGFKSRGVLTWKPKKGTLLYALFSQGFRPGGFNRGPSARVQDPTLPFINAATGAPEAAKTSSKDGKNFQLLVPAAYKPDTLTNWEMGLKTDLFDRKMTFNLSAYYMVWENTQLGFFNPAAGFGNTAFSTNGPNYHIKGIEAQVVARPVTGLSVQGSATYNDSKQATSPCFVANNPTASSFGQCITATYSGNVASPKAVASPFGNVGDVTPFSPHVQANARVRYDWAGKNDFTWFVGGGVSYTGSMYTEPATYPSGDVPDKLTNFPGPNGSVVYGTTVSRFKLSGYAILDAQIGFSHDNWTVSVFGDNLSNTHASTFTSSDEFIKNQVPVRPLTYGIKISTKI